MLTSYWARFHAWKDGSGYTVNVPDLSGCNTEGRNWDEAMTMAQEAVTGWPEITLHDGDELPMARSRGEIMALPVPPDMGRAEYAQVTVYLPDEETSLLPQGTWANLARLSVMEGVPVGELLTRAATEYLARHQSHA